MIHLTTEGMINLNDTIEAKTRKSVINSSTKLNSLKKRFRPQIQVQKSTEIVQPVSNLEDTMVR